MPSTTLTRTTTAAEVDWWGACRVCGERNYTLTDTRRIPRHPVPGYGPGRPDCRGGHQHPAPGSIAPARWHGAESANYQPIRENPAGQR